MSKEQDVKIILGKFFSGVEQLSREACDSLGELVAQEEAKQTPSEKPSISEIDFLNQKYQSIKSDKIKGLEVCFKSDNIADTWQKLYNTLKANNATIKDHYSCEGFTHYYWLYSEKYQDRFYRKKER
jgi:hypothetical protein